MPMCTAVGLLAAVLLQSHAHKRQRLLWIAMVSVRKNTVRNVGANHSILNFLFEIRIEVLENHLSDRRDGGSPILRQLFKILLNRCRFTLLCCLSVLRTMF